MTRTIASLAVTAVSAALVACSPQAAPSTPPHAAAPALAAEDPRVEAWLAQLTREEKLALVGGTGFDTVGVPRLGIPSLRMTDGPVGVRAGKSTAFPASVAMAATFDPALIERVGGALGREAKAKGKNVLLGPCVNIQRAPHGGRNFESFGEDPYLAARAAVAYIRGVQREGVVATVKHFAANNQETDRHTIDVIVDERTLHEIYFPAFEAAVKEAKVEAVMCSYNKLNGPWACENPGLLTGVLEQRWGFTGLVMSDWEATHSVAPAVRAGLDLEMPKGAFLSPAHLAEALAQGAVSAGAIDEMVRRQLRVIAAMGLSDAPASGPIDPPENRALAREVARAGVVLLKNEGSVLPLDRARLKRLAVIGPRAAWVDGGGGSARVSPVRAVSLLSALREALGPAVQVDYAAGGFAPESLEVVPAQVLSPPPGEGSGPGLLGEYFTGTEHVLHGGGPQAPDAPKLRRIDPTVDFNFHLDGPTKDFPVDDFSIVWRGRLTAPETGRYLLALASDDGSRLYLDGKLVVDDWGQHPVVLKWAEIELTAGQPHDVRLEYYETILGASVSLLWKKLEPEPADHVREAAKAADAVLVYVGDTDLDETEGSDRSSLTLPGHQEDLVRTALAANPRTAVIVGTGAPVLLGGFLPAAPAVLQAWFAGEEAGHALADVLLGDASPSGKLPVTFPKRWEDSPAFGNFPGSGGEVRYAEGLLVGYRHFDTRKVAPEFPFGHGLSYTTFAYRDLVVGAPDAQHRVELRVQVKNTGARRGAEVVQVYLHPVDPPLARPEQALAGFAKVDLAPGEEREVRLTLEARAFSFYDPARHDWALERGRFEIRVGSSSRDVLARAAITLE